MYDTNLGYIFKKISIKFKQSKMS